MGVRIELNGEIWVNQDWHPVPLLIRTFDGSIEIYINREGHEHPPILINTEKLYWAIKTLEHAPEDRDEDNAPADDDGGAS